MAVLFQITPSPPTISHEQGHVSQQQGRAVCLIFWIQRVKGLASNPCWVWHVWKGLWIHLELALLCPPQCVVPAPAVSGHSTSSVATASKYRPVLSRKLSLHSDCSNGKHNVNNVASHPEKIKTGFICSFFSLVYISSCDILFDVLKTRLLSQHGLFFSFETSQHLHFWSEKCWDLWIDYFFAGFENLSV